MLAPGKNNNQGEIGNPHRIILDTPFLCKSTISYGLIVYAKNTKKWAIVQRRHSIEFMVFIRGIYRITHLPFLLSCIMEDESKSIQKCLCGGPELFRKLYLTELHLPQEGLEYALIRMAESRNIVLNLLTNLNLENNVLDWNWPKGRMSYSTDPFSRESAFDCAVREFSEEVEITLPSHIFISDTYVTETVSTITGRNIEARYWIYIISDEVPMPVQNDNFEVRDKKWVTTEECQSLLRRNTLFGEISKIVDTIE